MFVNPKSLLDRISETYRARRIEEARSLTDALLLATPEHPIGWMWRAIIAMSQGRYEDAVSAFERRNEIEPDPLALTHLGACHAKLGCLEEAHNAYSRALALAPRAEAYLGLATVLHGMQRFDEAMSALDAADLIAPELSQVALRRGCTLLELKRFEEATDAFARSIALSPDFIISRLIALDRPTLNAITASAAMIGRPTHVLEKKSEQSCKPRAVVLVSCDPVYARKYGFPFLRSYAEHAQTDHLLHVHIFDPDPAVVGELDSVAANAGIANYVVTVEKSPFADGQAQARKAYYAAGRLLHLPSLLGAYLAPILSLDIDLIVEAPLSSLIEAHPDADIVLHRRRPIHSPWRDVVADVIVAYPTKAAAEYLSKVGAYARKYLLSESNPWFIDQTALYCVLTMLERFSQIPKVAWTEDAHKSVLWHFGHSYDHSMNDPRFKKYV